MNETVEKQSGENRLSDLSTDLENWMTKLPAKLKSQPIIQLAIPGKQILLFYDGIQLFCCGRSYGDSSVTRENRQKDNLITKNLYHYFFEYLFNF